jgi:anti-sigma B factor antagonist
MPTTDEPGAPSGRAEITRDTAGVPVIKLVGEIDLSNVDSVRAAIEPTVSSTSELLVFDLSGLEFLDSSGIALLLFAAANTGSVQLRSPSEIVRRIIEVTGLADVLHIVDP